MHPSPTDLLVLHAVRLKGFADTDAVAARFALDAAQTHEELLDAEAYGWVTRSAFADLTGWSLTEAGRRQNEARLREELDRVGARAAVVAVHDAFLPLNTQAAHAFTAWQLGSADPGTAAAPPSSGGVPDWLDELAHSLHQLEPRLTAHLDRFGGYHRRFAAALARAGEDRAWITGMEVDSCHRIWFELHEDLIASLNLSR
ncbi:transcriptional regulator [Catellatospora sp. NPDC049609]|uniref:transcriptional regulator n=1 Tax=Catellatospora sp. NPDC049609 TaxID=3155505 RepID=UPI0034483FCE